VQHGPAPSGLVGPLTPPHVVRAVAPDGWADLAISNGVLDLVPDELAAYAEIMRALRPQGRVQIAGVCVEVEVPDEAKREIDLWKAWIAGALPCVGWQTVIEGVGLPMGRARGRRPDLRGQGVRLHVGEAGPV